MAGGSHNIRAVQRSLCGAFELLSYAVYVRTSIILARISAAQSGRQLPTLSGRAIPHSTEENDETLDECHKSLLGALLGVTAEIESSRREAKRLAELGDVQRMVGMKPGVFDEDGMLYDTNKPKSRAQPPPPTEPAPIVPPPPPTPRSVVERPAAPAASSSKVASSADTRLESSARVPAVKQNTDKPVSSTARTSRSPLVGESARCPELILLAPGTNSRSQPYVEIPLRRPSVTKHKDSDVEVASKVTTNGVPPSKKHDASSKSAPQALLTSTRPNSQPTTSSNTATDSVRNYIELDSPPPSDSKLSASHARDISPNDSDDSRYAVRKPRKKPIAAPTTFNRVDKLNHDAESSGSDSDIVFVSDGKGPKAVAQKSIALPTPPASKSRESKKTETHAKKDTSKSNDDQSSDMDIASNSSSGGGKAAKGTNSRRTTRKRPAQRKGTSPQKLTALQRQEYWKGKGHGSGHTVSSDSDSDTVYVRSR